jgi:hypothetical protein
MSVIKAKRKPSQFEVFHHLYKLRKEITDLLLRNFGYDSEKSTKRLLKKFGKETIEELTEEQKVIYDKLKIKTESFDKWFIESERDTIVNCLRQITKEVYLANSIYPTEEFHNELEERQLHQSLAIGYCYDLVQELQYSIETLPVDINKYTYFGNEIQTQINLIRGWKKSDRKRFRVTSDSAANFANVNNNGNCNYNNASNSNGVRPDFDSAIN